MESIDTELAVRIRNDIIHDAHAAGQRLSEAQLCETHGVSRTPVWLALRILKQKGIIRRGEGRGYTIQFPTIADFLQASRYAGTLRIWQPR